MEELNELNDIIIERQDQIIKNLKEQIEILKKLLELKENEK